MSILAICSAYPQLPCPLGDSFIEIGQQFIQVRVACLAFPDDSAFVQRSGHGTTVVRSSALDPTIRDPLGDVRVLPRRGRFLSDPRPPAV